ncbi:helix-turn-helix domain-containing protein [Paenibacillus sp. NRS-1783]|uniref:helix-turn-helix domain-containing protein n=1 Tax=Paenibacillus sp. NRS-1783 TaxID=3233907 RepID=UPI003D274C98
MKPTDFNSVFENLVEKSPYSDSEIARRLGVNRSTIGRWKSGEQSPPLSKIPVIAELFGVHPMVFVGGDKSEDDNTAERHFIRKYKFLDEKGKHTVNTVLDMEFNRVQKSHLDVVAAHADDYSEEQIKLMKQDLDEL